MDLGEWLRSLSLEQYEAAFRENGVSEQVLPNLTDRRTWRSWASAWSVIAACCLDAIADSAGAGRPSAPSPLSGRSLGSLLPCRQATPPNAGNSP